jgi:hypothetical protein
MRGHWGPAKVISQARHVSTTKTKPRSLHAALFIKSSLCRCLALAFVNSSRCQPDTLLHVPNTAVPCYYATLDPVAGLFLWRFFVGARSDSAKYRSVDHFVRGYPQPSGRCFPGAPISSYPFSRFHSCISILCRSMIARPETDGRGGMHYACSCETPARMLVYLYR